jgi:hypothetical protein
MRQDILGMAASQIGDPESRTAAPTKNIGPDQINRLGALICGTVGYARLETSIIGNADIRQLVQT